MASKAPASRSKIVARGLTRRCPRCGAGHLFRHYFELIPDCPKCGLHFEREPGYFAGALAINIIVAGGLFAVVFVALLAATIPTVPVVELLVVLVPIVVLRLAVRRISISGSSANITSPSTMQSSLTCPLMVSLTLSVKTRGFTRGCS